MSGTVKQCAFLFLPKGSDIPSAAVYAEVAGDGEAFFAGIDELIDMFGTFRGSKLEGSNFTYKKIIDGQEEVCDVCCDDDGRSEGEIILSVLYNYISQTDFSIAIKRIHYKGSIYTDISGIALIEDTCILWGQEQDTLSIQLHAKKDERPVTVCFFGPEVGWVGGRIGYIKYYPSSNGVVEIGENQQYIGSFSITEWCRYDANDYFVMDDDGNIRYAGEGLEPYIKEEDAPACVRVFGEKAGQDVTFRLLYHGKLYKKISKNEDAVIFYYTAFDESSENVRQAYEEYEQGENPWDMVFKNIGGQYHYSIENQTIEESSFSDVIFTPPAIIDTDKFSQEDGRKLYDDYIQALYAAFAGAQTYQSAIGSQVFTHMAGTEDLFLTQMEDFVLTGKLAPSISEDMDDRYNYFENGHGDKNFVIEKAAFDIDGTSVAFVWQDDGLTIEVNDAMQKKSYCRTFDELNKRNFFSSIDLPKTIRFDQKFPSFAKDLEIYQAIRNAIQTDYQTFLGILSETTQSLSYEDMEKALYGEDKIVDKDVVSFAMEMQNTFQRKGTIPNIALIGEAGTGKSFMVAQLGKVVFNKEVMHLSPSDLKAAYEGQTKYEVVRKLKEAAAEKQIFFIDEAYELMADEYGREAISILLPMMTGDRKKIDASRDKYSISADFTESGIPPIWIAGYEDDIRLMISQNQGLFRRFQRVTLKTPTTSELYTELLTKLKSALDKLLRGGDSDLFLYNAAMAEPMGYKYNVLLKQFTDNETLIIKFFRWGTQPQNSRYFANHAGVQNFLERCLDSIDFNKPESDITHQIEKIITFIKRDIKHQLDTIRRKGDSNRLRQYDDSERVAMVFDNKTRFADLVGCDEQIAYMKDIIHLFVEKSQYEQNNITIPKGALLLGEPGVGKTFIARAMAGELQEAFAKASPDKKVGFMSLSAPELTAKPVSFIGSIFDAAEEYDVCVIFIDEVDAIAKNRAENEHYGHFIELIKQMDGIEQRANIFVLAATNVYEYLDPAFTRSGRIDKKLSFTLPDRAARRELTEKGIIKRCGALANFYYEENKKGVNNLAEEIAAITPGCTPGDIENIVNAAFIMYAKDPSVGSAQDTPQFGNAELDRLYRHLYEAVERNTIGEPHPAKKEREFSVTKNDQSCSAVSVHEVGHALVSILCGGEPFEKITSLPRGNMLGYVMPVKNELLTKKDYENRIRTAMGGRIAEEIVYGKNNISTGAYKDIKNATHFAQMMVESLGFTEDFKFMALGRGYGQSEVNRLLEKLYQETRALLANNKALIIPLAEQVFKNETMTGQEFIALYNQLTKKKS